MLKRPQNAAQLRRMKDVELEAFLNDCEERGDTGLMYQLACDEEIAREDRTHVLYHDDDQQERWC